MEDSLGSLALPPGGLDPVDQSIGLPRFPEVRTSDRVHVPRAAGLAVVSEDVSLFCLCLTIASEMVDHVCSMKTLVSYMYLHRISLANPIAICKLSIGDLLAIQSWDLQSFFQYSCKKVSILFQQ